MWGSQSGVVVYIVLACYLVVNNPDWEDLKCTTMLIKYLKLKQVIVQIILNSITNISILRQYLNTI